MGVSEPPQRHSAFLNPSVDPIHLLVSSQWTQASTLSLSLGLETARALYLAAWCTFLTCKISFPDRDWPYWVGAYKFERECGATPAKVVAAPAPTCFTTPVKPWTQFDILKGSDGRPEPVAVQVDYAFATTLTVVDSDWRNGRYSVAIDGAIVGVTSAIVGGKDFCGGDGEKCVALGFSCESNEL